MIKKITFAVLMLTAPLFAATAQNVENNNQASAQQDDDAKYATELLKPGTEAPDFALATPDGKTVKLSDMRGKYVVLDFWASWCGDCRRDIPNMVRMHREYGDRVMFIGISLDTDAERLRSFLAQNGVDYLQLCEGVKFRESAVAKLYGVEWIPSMFLISPEGKVVLSTVVSEKLEREMDVRFSTH